MYTLRTIVEFKVSEDSPYDTIITNQALGDTYIVLRNGSTSEFDTRMAQDYPDFDKSQVKALVLGCKEKSFLILKNSPSTQNTYYVMSEGKTLERL